MWYLGPKPILREESAMSIRKQAFIYLVLFLLAVPVSLTAGDLEIFVIDVKQGDATLIRGPNGTTILVDAGMYSYASTNILDLLDELGISSLDYTLATHFDQDHIDGFCDVLAETGPPTVAYDRGGDRRSSGAASATPAVFTNYVSCVGGARQAITAGSVIDLGDGAVLRVLATGDPDYLVDATSDYTTLWDGTRLACANKENEKSVGVAVEYGGFDLLLLGDLTGIADPPAECSEDRLNVEMPVADLYTGAPFNRGVDVYHADHHGSDLTSNGHDFLWAILPETAVISVGDSTQCGPGFNSYGHPGQLLLDRLFLTGADKVYQTQEGGADYVSSVLPCSPQTGETYPRDYHGMPHDFLYTDHIRIVTDGTTYSISNAAGGTDLYDVDDLTGDDDDDLCSTDERGSACPSGLEHRLRVRRVQRLLEDHLAVYEYLRALEQDEAWMARLPDSIQRFLSDVVTGN